MNTLVFEPLISTALWVSLTVGAAALLAWYARDSKRRLPRSRWMLTTALMGLAIALPLVIVLNPTWLTRIPPPAGRPALTILVDHSASMATRDAGADKSRFAEAEATAARLATELGSRYETELRRFSSELAPQAGTGATTSQPTGQATDLAAAITGALGEDRPQGQALLLISDGIHNATAGSAAVLEAARRAKGMATPIYTKTVGGPATVRDLALSVLSPQELAFVGQRVVLRAELDLRGIPQQAVEIELFDQDKLLEKRTAQLTEGVNEVDFNVTPATSGLFRYELRAGTVAGEVTQANNRSAYLVRVIDKPIRVLLLEGKPYWDTKFLVRTLSADPAIELVSVVRLAEDRLLERQLARPAQPAAAGAQPPGAGAPATAPAQPAENTAAPGAESSAKQLSDAEPTDTKPTDTKPPDAKSPDAKSPDAGRSETSRILSSPEALIARTGALDSYQVLILGRDAEVFLSDDALTQIRRWLAQQGGCLVCARGAPMARLSAPVEQLLPVRWNPARENRFRMELTTSGAELRWLVKDNAAEGQVLTEMPTLAVSGLASDTRAQASVWATARLAGREDPMPAISTLPYGTGRVVVVEGAGMWRWAFLAPQYSQREQVYGLLWQSLLRYIVSTTGLLPSQDRVVRSDKSQFNTREIATATLLVRHDKLEKQVPAIEIEGPGGRQTVAPTPMGQEPGSFRIVFGKLPEGVYRVKLAGAADADASARTIFEVRNNLDEVLKLKANPELMAQISTDSGGAPLVGSGTQEITERFEEHLRRAYPEQVASTAAWDRWWVLVGTFAIWATTWGIRRSSGLI